MTTCQTTKNILSSAVDIQKFTSGAVLFESKDSWGKSYDLFRFAFSAVPYVAKGHDSSFTIHIKHVLFKENKRGKERKEEEDVYFETLILSSLLLK